MAEAKIDISGGLFENVEDFELSDSGKAAVLKNLLVNDAGSNIGRPGYSLFTTISDSPVESMAFFKERIVLVTQERKIYSVNEGGAVTDITGSALEGANRPKFANDGSYLAIAGGGEPRQWSGSGNTASLVGSPPDTTNITYLDGYWILHLTSDQELRWAGPTAALRQTFNTSDFFQAESLPDVVRAHRTLVRDLYVFGAQSTELFYNYGDSAVPFKRTFVFDIGIGADHSIVKADNTLFWLTNEKRFVRMVDRTPQIISSPFDKTIRDFHTVEDCYGTKIDISGFYLIVWTFPTEGRTFVFDYKSSVWSEWERFNHNIGAVFNMADHVYSTTWNKHIIASRTTGELHQLSFDTRTDDSEQIKMVRRTGYITHGTAQRKRSNYYILNIKRGVGALSGAEPQLEIRINDDNKGWSEPYRAQLGLTGSEEEPVRVNLRGIYRKRQIEFTFTDSAEFILNSVYEDVEVMSS